MNDLGKETVTWVEIDEGSCQQRIDNFLCKHLKGVPKSHIYRILRNGEVRVNKKRADQTYRLQMGDLVRIPPVRVAQPAQRDYVPAVEFPVLYEDDGISLDYLKGKATWTHISWNDKAKQLSVEPAAPKGFTNQVNNRMFKVELLPEGITKDINYSGKPIKISF